jgi:phage terminase large subunit-like protein
VLDRTGQVPWENEPWRRSLCRGFWPHNGAVLPFFWLPAEGPTDRDRKEGGHYRTSRDAGLLETTPGKAINFKAIARRLVEIAAEYEIRAVAYDRSRPSRRCATKRA